MKNLSLFLIFTVYFTEIITAAPLIPLGEGTQTQCYQKLCPIETVACRKITKTTEDKKSLSVNVACLDAENLVLKEYFEYEDNPYGPHTQYKSTSFSGTYTHNGSGTQVVNINNHINNDKMRLRNNDFY